MTVDFNSDYPFASILLSMMVSLAMLFPKADTVDSRSKERKDIVRSRFIKSD
jgi:hypothetical protein